MKQPNTICRGHKVAINPNCYDCIVTPLNQICPNYKPTLRELQGLTQRQKFIERYGEDYLQVLDARG